MDKCVVVVGSFAGGHEFYGPFDSPKDALAYADYNFRAHSFTLVPLEEPDDYEGSSGSIVLLIGDGHTGHSIVGTFHCSYCAIQWESEHDADSGGYNFLWVELSAPE